MATRAAPVVSVFFVALLVSCGGGVTVGPPPPGQSPDFSIAVNPGTVNTAPGGTSNGASVSITGLNNFSGAVVVNIVGLPPGAMTSPLAPFAVNAGASQMVTVTVPAGAATGNVALTVTGTSGQLNHSAGLVLAVSPGPPAPDFSIAVNPGTVSAAPGATTNAAIVSIAALGGFSGQVSVSIAGLPQGVTSSPAAPFSIAAGGSQQVTLALPLNAAPGSVGLTLAGTSGQLTHTTPLILTINGTPGSDQIVVVGHTDSTNFPTTPGSPLPNALGGGDGFVASVRLAGNTSTTFSTYFGGNNVEQLRDVAIDGQGNIYVTGQTASPNIPLLIPPAATAGVLRPSCNGCSTAAPDAFVAKFDPSGQLLRFTYLGGSGADEGYNIYVDGNGFIYVGGRTSSLDYPVTANAAQTTFGGGTFDFHVTKLQPDLSAVVWATYLGGSREDTGRGRIFADSSGVYIGGESRSNNFPSAVGQLRGASDAVIAKISPDGRNLLYVTFVGGNNATIPEGAPGGLVVNSAGEVYACGLTSAADFPVTTTRGFGGQTDGFVVRLSSTGTVLAATYIGGLGNDSCEGLALEASGNVAMLSTTNSSNFPTTAGVLSPTARGGIDFAITRLSPNLSQILMSTYVGAAGDDFGDTLRLDLDASGNFVWVGLTDSTAFPVTAGAVQANYGGGSADAVFVVLSSDGTQIRFATFLGGSGREVPRSVRYRRNP